MNWKKFILLIGSCTALAAGIVLACADGPDPYDEYPSFFFNNINKKPAFAPFYFTTLLTYYNQGYDFTDTAAGNVPDLNSAAWLAYTGKEVTEADIDSFIYAFPLADVRHIYESAANGATLSVPGAEVANTFTKWLLKQKDTTALSYLVYAKQCEQNAQPLSEYYNNVTKKWEMPVRDAAVTKNLQDIGTSRSSAIKNTFIAERYKYQALRMAFYSDRFADALQLYDRFFGDKMPTSVIGYRCLGLKAGCLFKQGKTVDAAYLYSKIFDNSDEMKLTAYTSFNRAVKGNIDTVLPLCRSGHDKAVIYAMRGLYEFSGDEQNGLSMLQQAYAADPNVSGLDIIMTREMNKAEQRFMAPHYTVANTRFDGGDETTLAGDPKAQAERAEEAAYLKQLNNFAQKIAGDNKTADVAFWHLASAYIYQMLGDNANCTKYLALAQHENMNNLEHDVHDIVSALNIITRDKKITAQTEADLLPSLKWIEQRTAVQPRFTKVYNDFMTGVLSATYLHQGDTMKAVFCLSRKQNAKHTDESFNDFTDVPGTFLEAMTPARLEQIQNFVQQPDKPAYDQWLTGNTMYSVGVLQELEGTKYIREHQFDKAVSVLSKIPASLLGGSELPDFLISHILDAQELNASDTATTYNKLSFARKMVELQQAIAKNPNDGRAAYQYANALYSISYYGKANHAQVYYRGGTDEYAYIANPDRKKLNASMQEYYNVAQAEKYYIQAFTNTTDAEVKARCLFMASKCWQKNCPPPAGKDKYYYYDPSSETFYYTNSLRSPYFKQLKQGYAKTKFYTTAKNTCSYFADYLKKG